MNKIIILSAGASSRFWPLTSSFHKAFYRCGRGKTIIEETVLSLLDKAEELDIVVSPRDLEIAKQLFQSEKKVKIVVLERPTGAGNAILAALPENYKGDFFVTFADKITAGKILQELKKEKEAIALRKTANPEYYGIVAMDKNNYITSVVEKPAKDKAPSQFKITGAYLLNSTILPLLKENTAEHYSLEISLNEYFKQNQVKGVFVDEIPETSLKFPWDLLDVNKKLQIADFKNFIHKEAKIAKTAVIEGPVYIGKGVRIMDFATVIGPSFIGENSLIGNFSLVRQNSFLDSNVLVGAHSEVKNSILSSGVHLHRSYVGDSIIDENTRLGAGVVLANKRNDGKEIRSVVKNSKISTGLSALGAVIGRNTKIGVNVSIMPGVKIGSNASVWPGSLVKEDLGDNTTFKL